MKNSSKLSINKSKTPVMIITDFIAAKNISSNSASNFSTDFAPDFYRYASLLDKVDNDDLLSTSILAARKTDKNSSVLNLVLKSKIIRHVFLACTATVGYLKSKIIRHVFLSVSRSESKNEKKINFPGKKAHQCSF